jgi:uncharacterized protein (UPF0548 family)
MFLLRRPAAADAKRILDNCAHLPLSYAPVGISLQTPARYDVDEVVVTIGRGEADFARAGEGLAAWKHFGFDWVEVFPKTAPLDVGTNVIVVIRHLGFWSANGARIVSRALATPARPAFGFSYGTLTNHAERGEELFEVFLDVASGDVKYRIRAVSQPRAMLARIGYPIARSLQARFRRESVTAMFDWTAGVG